MNSAIVPINNPRQIPNNIPDKKTAAVINSKLGMEIKANPKAMATPVKSPVITVSFKFLTLDTLSGEAFCA